MTQRRPGSCHREVQYISDDSSSHTVFGFASVTSATYDVPTSTAMSSYAHLGVLVLVVIIPASTGNGGGAPNTACVDMSPQHGPVEQTSSNNFSLEWTGNTTQGNDILKGRVFVEYV